MGFPGGEHYATKEIQEICDQVKTKVEEMTGRNLEEFKAFVYRELKISVSTTYQVKVYVGGTEYFHVLIHQTASETGEVKITVEHVEQHHEKDDVIIPVD
ncbi:cystatin-A5-like [Poecilia latipinna]|uniref:cystatin-A5-like n=1 Tax=Poecilia latipinna TaxID=48699 RepID=UPI00072E2315|nr:PREDICTED: cystatin-A5-like [Poecilia latipinna]